MIFSLWQFCTCCTHLKWRTKPGWCRERLRHKLGHPAQKLALPKKGGRFPTCCNVTCLFWRGDLATEERELGGWVAPHGVTFYRNVHFISPITPTFAHCSRPKNVSSATPTTPPSVPP